MKLTLEQLTTHLQKIRDEQGEGAFQDALTGLAKDLILEDKGMDYIKNLLSQLEAKVDLAGIEVQAKKERAEREAAAKNPPPGGNQNEVFINALKQQMPNLRTQAHFDLLARAFDALRICLNASYGGDLESAEKARGGLNQLLDLSYRLSEVDEKLEGNPEATSNTDFTTPPKQYEDHDLVKDLLEELEVLSSLTGLNAWYEDSKPRMNLISSQELRNKLYDSIRIKKKGFES